MKRGFIKKGQHGFIDQLYGVLGGGGSGNHGVGATANRKIRGDIFEKENEQEQIGHNYRSAVPHEVTKVGEKPQGVTTEGNMVR